MNAGVDIEREILRDVVEELLRSCIFRSLALCDLYTLLALEVKLCSTPSLSFQCFPVASAPC